MKKEDLIAKAAADGIKMTDLAAEEILAANRLDEEDLDVVSGGVIERGVWRPSAEMYSRAGITWHHSVFTKDTYYFRGVKISQEVADRIYSAYELDGRQMTKEEISQRFGIEVPY